MRVLTKIRIFAIISAQQWFSNKGRQIMKKKIIKNFMSLAMCSIIVFGVFACSKPEEIVNAGTKITFCANGQNVMREESFTGGDEFVLNTFLGDVEAGQLIINPGNDVENFNVKITDLTHEDGSEKITSDLCEILVERYINVDASCCGTEDGWYPDALIPIKNYIGKRENKITKGNNQGIWINVNVPKDSLPGKYTGSIEVTLDDDKKDVPVTVNVYNIEMPDQVHAKTAHFVYNELIADGEGKPGTPELYEKYYDFLLNKRMTLRCFPGFENVNTRYNPVEFAEAVAVYTRDGRVSTYNMPYVGANKLTDVNYMDEVLVAIAEKNIELIESGEDIDLFEKAFFNLGAFIDEPTREKFELVKENDLRIQNAKIRLADSELLKDYPNLQESVIKIPHIVTSHIDKELYGTDEVGGVQTWCPQFKHFATKSQRALVLERLNSTDRRGGEGVWWYGCIQPHNPFPTYHTCDDLLSVRSLKWMQYSCKVQGEIYWCVNYWQKSVGNVKSKTNVWTDPVSYENCSGDGRLVYPGSKYGIDGLISTLRVESQRESAEDYELFYLLDKGINSINEEFGKTYDVDKILEKFYSRVFDGVVLNIGATANDLESARKDLLTLCEKVCNDKSAAISLLNEYNA